MNKIIITLMLFFIGLTAMSQTFLISDDLGTAESSTWTCSGTLYDSGGAGSNYNNDENYTGTICSDNGSTITITFTEFDTELNYDFLTIIDGPIEDAPVLVASASGTSLRGRSFTSSSNCLTFVWTSNSTNTRPGFAANITCGMNCQAFTVNHQSSTTPMTDGTNFIDLCQGTELTITVTGTYPNNGSQGYQQSNSTVNFNWLYITGGRDTTRTNGLNMVSHTRTFTEPGGHYIVVYGVDENGCRNTNYREYKIRVSGNPTFAGTTITPNPVCPGDTVNLIGEVQPFSWRAPIPDIFAGTTFLPDGSGATYTTSLEFTMFGANDRIRTAEDIEQILFNMEHSYLGDLSLSITCPSGNNCLLKSYSTGNPRPVTNYGNNGSTGGGSIHLGFAPDPISSSNPCYLTPGEGLDYWFIPGGTDNFGAGGPTTSITYTDPCGNTETWQQLNSGPYGSYENMSVLIGCPLNGNWTVTIKDHLGSDNGYIFYWGIRFAEDLYPENLWTIENNPASYLWSGENVVNGNNINALGVPTSFGQNVPYTFQMTDNFGCSYDTIVDVTVRDREDALCCIRRNISAGQNASTCELFYQLGATALTADYTGIWTVTGGAASSISFDNVADPNTIARLQNNMFGTYEFTWTEYYRGQEFCSSSATVSITFNPTFDPSIDAISNMCKSGSLVQIVAQSYGTLSISPQTGALDVNNRVFNPSLAAPGTYTITNEVVAECVLNNGIGTASFQVYDELEVTGVTESCVNTIELQVQFTVNGSAGPAASYNVNGMPQTSNPYSNMPGTSEYNYIVTDVHGCSEIIVNGYRNCGCPYYSGTMSTLQLQVLCAGMCIDDTFTHNGDMNDATDPPQGYFEFIIHSGNNVPLRRYASVGEICPSNIPGFSFNTIYYVSPVMSANSAGQADLNHICRSIGAGTPVMWQQSPVADAGRDKDTCGVTIRLQGSPVPSGMFGYWTVVSPAPYNSYYTTGGTSNNDNNPIVVVQQPGDYSFVWHVVNGDCMSSDTVNIGFKVPPRPYAGANDVICGGEIELNAQPTYTTAEGSRYSWEGSQVSFTPNDQASTSARLTTSNYGTHELVFAESYLGCSGQSRVLVTFIKIPEPAILTPVDTVCGTEYNLSVLNSDVGTNPNVTGRWRAYENNIEVFPSFSPAGANIPNVRVDIGSFSSGVLTRSLEFRWEERNSSHGEVCTSSVTTQILFIRKPNAQILGDDLINVCGNCVTLNANMEGATPGAEGTWVLKEPMEGTWEPDITSPNATFCATQAGIFGNTGAVGIGLSWTQTITTGGTYACSSSANVTVNMYQKPVANAGLDATICGNEYTLGAVFNIPENDDYIPWGSWSAILENPGETANIQQSTTDHSINDTVSVSVSSSRIWQFVFTERNGNPAIGECLSRDTVRVEFVNYPSVYVGEDRNICGNRDTLRAQDGNASGGFWSSSHSANIDDSNVRITGVTGDYGINYRFVWYAHNNSISGIEPAAVCPSSDTVYITFWEKPSAAITTPAEDADQCGRTDICNVLKADPPGSGITGYWKGATNVSFSDEHSASNVCILSVPFFRPYEFMWIEYVNSMPQNFCADTARFTITFHEMPNANAGNDTLFCGSRGTIRATPSVGTGLWKSDRVDNVIGFGNETNATTTIDCDVYFGTYDIIWLERNNICTDGDTIKVTFQKLPSAEVSVIDPKCSKWPAVITANETELTNYRWNLDGGVIDSSRYNTNGGE
ncbi:MAG: CUB domain-containing protein, partial [Bacteroidales bacterium]|nr:CUB domain-containing protein [Bacteroidales bacterium]